MIDQLGIMVCGHGSRDEHAVEEFQSVARGLRERIPQYPVEWGFLEFATPIIRDGLDELQKKGVNRVLAVPGMLFAAGHAKNDIPSGSILIKLSKRISASNTVESLASTPEWSERQEHASRRH